MDRGYGITQERGVDGVYVLLYRFDPTRIELAGRILGLFFVLCLQITHGVGVCHNDILSPEILLSHTMPCSAVLRGMPINSNAS